MNLPQFIGDGVLPQGDFELTISELKSSMLVRGVDGFPKSIHWDNSWRMKLVENLEKMVDQLKQVGITDQFGNELDFPSAFRTSRRNDSPKGIIRIGGLS